MKSFVYFWVKHDQLLLTLFLGMYSSLDANTQLLLSDMFGFMFIDFSREHKCIANMEKSHFF